MAIDFTRGRVAILGAGREGLAVRRFLRARHPDLSLTLVAEQTPDPEFTASLGERDRLLVGPLSSAGLSDYSVLVRSPGISPYRRSIQDAVAAGARLTTPSNLWFAAHPRARTICVTGTKGKSTTCALLAHTLQHGGFSTRLAGNIGRPMLDCDASGVDWWVIELSSYQIADLEARPTLAVILNLSPEHLDWHGSAERYRADKLRLAELTGGRPLVVNAADASLRAALANHPGVIWFNAAGGLRAAEGRLFDGEEECPLTVPPGLPGMHNLSNLAAVFTVLRILGADTAAAAASLRSFRSLPHRLQAVGERDGIRFVDDSISSTPVATLAALDAYRGENVTLLLGGLDRGIDWSPYLQGIDERLPVAVIGMPDSGARLIRELRESGIRPAGGLHACGSLDEAMQLARRLTPRGGVVLLSPGAPSFPHFRDFRDRGRRFADLAGLPPPEEASA